MYTVRPAIDELARAVGVVYNSSRHFPLARLLQRRFQLRCAPIVHEKCQQLGHVAGKQHECLQYGMCVHVGDGLELFRLRNSCLAEMKSIFQPKTSLRDDLAAGLIVLHFSGIIEPIVNPWARRDAAKAGTPTDGAKKDVWLHVSHMSFSSYEPFWLPMCQENSDLDVAYMDIP